MDIGLGCAETILRDTGGCGAATPGVLQISSDTPQINPAVLTFEPGGISNPAGLPLKYCSSRQAGTPSPRAAAVAADMAYSCGVSRKERSIMKPRFFLRLARFLGWQWLRFSLRLMIDRWAPRIMPLLLAVHGGHF
eukprot:COSAG05_NODE_8_length_40675_cov_148.837539_16_plen_136_part_00